VRDIAGRWDASKTAVGRHRAHIAAAIAVAEREAGISTLHDVLGRMADLQRRVERLADKLERRKDHRTTLQAYREAREGLRAVSELLTATDLERRLTALEGGTDESDIESAA
jgi:hypothetical protein